MDMTGFTRLEVGASTKFRHMWFRLGDEDAQVGTLRVEFHNRNGADVPGAVYDYRCTQDLVTEMVEKAQQIGGPSFGSLFHKEVIAQPALYPYTLIRKAE